MTYFIMDVLDFTYTNFIVVWSFVHIIIHDNICKRRGASC